MFVSAKKYSIFIAPFACATVAHAQTNPAPLAPDPTIASQTRPDERTARTSAPIDVPAAGTGAETIGSSMQLMVRGVTVEGAGDLNDNRVRAAVAPFENRLLSREDLQRLLAAVSGVARADGFLFARSTIPAQELTDGVLLIRLDLGKIDEARLIGADVPAAQDLLAPLVGRAPRKTELEQQLMLVGDLPGVSLGSSRYVVENGRGILVVPVSHKAVTARAALDNRGLSALGPIRLQLGVDINGVLASDDQLSIDGVITPVQPKELAAVFGRYSRQINSAGTTVAVSASYAKTRLGEPYAAYNAHGDSMVLTASIMHPLQRSRASSIWVGASLKEALINQFWEDSRVLRDRITSVGVNVNGFWMFAGGGLRAGAALSQGVTFLGGTQQGDIYASRPGAGSDFTKIAFSSSWQGRLIGPLSARLALEAQWASSPLPSSEQITIGGPNFGRAYEFGERGGDRGILTSAELRGDIINSRNGPLNLLQLYGFVDMGNVSNISYAYGAGTRYSAGPGARLTVLNNIDLQLEGAFPLNSVRFESEDKSPRVSFTVKVRN